MKALLQRVGAARVEVGGEIVGSIDRGLLVLVGVEPEDGERCAAKMLHKLLNYRVFGDDEGKMNRSLLDVQGGLLLVSQFTLAANTRSGLRPSFSSARAGARRGGVRAPGETGAGGLSAGGDRAFRRRHAGAPGQRRAGDLPAGELIGVEGIFPKVLQGGMAGPER